MCLIKSEKGREKKEEKKSPALTNLHSSRKLTGKRNNIKQSNRKKAGPKILVNSFYKVLSEKWDLNRTVSIILIIITVISIALNKINKNVCIKLRHNI